ncbi:MAG: MerR family transcriptional regulator [Acidimicrobiia bacterium]
MDTTTIGDVARLAGITVRTLHHYDDIGLLTPTERRPNGYRGYTDRDISRLQQILAYRELDLGLDEIARILDEPSDSVEALATARHRIDDQLEKLRRIAAGLDAAIEAETKGIRMTPEEKLDAFGDFDPAEFADEAHERWGDSNAYRESVRRTSAYTPADWRQQQAETNEIYEALLALMSAGTPEDSPEAAALVDAHRASITRWFYNCTPEIHAGLGAMYVADERFRTNINASGDGLAEYLSAAIEARYAG